jgi:hypothetical protein
MTDFHELTFKAREAILSQRYAEALDALVAAHEAARGEHIAVRLSFGMMGWKELIDAYPPARTILEGMRDKAAAPLLAGQPLPDNFKEVTRYNEELGDPAHTYALFVHVEGHNPEFAADMGSIALPAIVACRDYVRGLRLMGDPLAQVKARAEQIDETSRHSDGMARNFALVTHMARYARMAEKILRGNSVDEQANMVEATVLGAINHEATRQLMQREMREPGTALKASVEWQQAQNPVNED